MRSLTFPFRVFGSRFPIKSVPSSRPDRDVVRVINRDSHGEAEFMVCAAQLIIYLTIYRISVY